MQGLNQSPWGHGFADIIDQWDWNETTDRIMSSTEDDVRRVLAKARRNTRRLEPEDFMVLISPAAESFIEEMAQLSRHFTRERFGNTISMYIPMYVSNACANACVYCGFNHANKFERTILTMEQVEAECRAIKELAPFDNLLIVSGEFPALCGTDYFENVLNVCRPYFNNMTIEIQPMKTEQYSRLVKAGLNGVVCFQETYRRETYKNYHPRGMKSVYDWRLNGYDRM